MVQSSCNLFGHKLKASHQIQDLILTAGAGVLATNASRNAGNVNNCVFAINICIARPVEAIQRVFNDRRCLIRVTRTAHYTVEQWPCIPLGLIGFIMPLVALDVIETVLVRRVIVRIGPPAFTGFCLSGGGHI